MTPVFSFLPNLGNMEIIVAVLVLFAIAWLLWSAFRFLMGMARDIRATRIATEKLTRRKGEGHEEI